MAKVGTAYVEIKPDLTGFARELKTRLTAMRQPQVKVRPDLDTFGTQVRAGIRRTGPELDRTGRWMADRIGKAFSAGWTVSGTKRFFRALSQMSDGIVGVLTTPIGIAAAALAAVFAAAFIGALTAALTGVAFIGFGVFIAAQEQVVKNAAKKLATTATKAFKEAAKPFIKPVVKALGVIEEATVRWAKTLRPVFGEMAKLVVPLTEALVSLTNQILSGMVGALPAMKSSLQALFPVLSKIGVAIGDFFRMLGRHPDEIAKLITILGDRLVGAIKAVTAVMEFAIVATVRWQEMIDKLTAGIKDWVANNPKIQQFRAEVAKAGEALKTGLSPANMPTGVRDLLTQVRDGAVAATADIRKSFTQLWAVVSPIVSKWVAIFQQHFVPMFRRLWIEAQPVLTQLGALFKSVFEFVAAVVRNAANGIAFWFSYIDRIATGIWNRFGKQIMSSIEGALKGVLKILQGAFQIIQGIFQVLTGILTGDWSKAWTGIKNIFFGAMKTITGGWQATANLLKGLWFAFLGAIQTQFSGAWNKIVSVAKSAWNGLVAFFSGIPKAILRSLGNLGNLLYGVGQSIVNGLVNGIQSMWWKVTDRVRALINKIPGPVRDMLGIGSPSKVFAAIGRELPRGMAQGIAKDTPLVSSAVQRMVTVPTMPRGDLAGQMTATGALTALVKVFIGDKELRDLVRVETDFLGDVAARELMAGRRFT